MLVILNPRQNQIQRRHTIQTMQKCLSNMNSGRSMISHWGAPSCLGFADPKCGCFSAKMYAKMKELDPTGGGHMLVAPPGSANDKQYSSNV